MSAGQPSSSRGAPQPADIAAKRAKVEQVLVDIRALGRLPTKKTENALALRLQRLREYMSEEQQAELDSLSVASQHADIAAKRAEVEEVLVDIRALGRLPKELRKPKDKNQRTEAALALRLRRLREYVSEEQKAELDSLSVAPQHAGPGLPEVMDFIRTFKRLPRQHQKPKTASDWEIKEHRLYKVYNNAEQRGLFTTDQLEEIRKVQAGGRKREKDAVMDWIRARGRLPKENTKAKDVEGRAECKVAQQLRRMRDSLREEEKAELATIREQEIGALEELMQEADPLSGFAAESSNRLEQDLHLFSAGVRTRELARRLRKYEKYMTDPVLQDRASVKMYKDLVLAALASTDQCLAYVPGDFIPGEELRTFSDEPGLCGPLVCQLCEGVNFLYEEDLARHQKDCHGGTAEYRKRVLYLMERQGYRPITGQEKRIIVQNFAHFQQWSRPGTKGNTFVHTAEVPRCEAACVFCQQKDWLENRFKLALFAPVPSEQTLLSFARDADAEDDDVPSAPGQRRCETPRGTLLQRDGVFYLQNPSKVHELLNVERYEKRWPLIPREELHASSVEHPENNTWRWLLHVRRVPVLAASTDATQLGASSSRLQLPEDDRPPCAGIGDPSACVWSCWDCLEDLAAKKPRMPLNACANDNWIGRERPHVRDASKATKMLASLGRVCMKQVRLGRRGDPAAQETALSGNTILFAQPTADVPSLELPPPTDALLDSLTVIFTRSIHDLSKAEWALVDREVYMRIVRERKTCCPCFADVVVREDVADTRLPASGVPEHIFACAQEVEGAEHAPTRLVGPASSRPDIGKMEEAGDDSEDHSEHGCADDDKETSGALRPEDVCDVPEDSIAVDPVHSVQPVKLMQALQANIEAIESHAAKIVKNEKRALIPDQTGTLQPVKDEGGRQCMQQLILDVQHTARSFDDNVQASVEKAIDRADARLDVCPTALAIPTQGPLDSFNARTYPACYVEWWFGDGAPALERDRPMLFEQVARRLLNIEEHEYHLNSDLAPYRASCTSRFNNPEIIAVLGDVARRLRLLRGTRAAIGRRGFSADLKAIAGASSADFLAAVNLATPKETIGTAAARPDMPDKVKTALRTLLLSTSDVAGTEGRKTSLRFNGHAANLLFGGPSFFNTPNFADTYNPIVKLLHDGPCADQHLGIGSALRSDASGSTTRTHGEGFLTAAEPRMPPLRRMHEIVAADPRAQAKFFLLMSELHYRYVIGIERLHIGRVTLAKPRCPVHDECATSLQPSVAPGTMDLQAPLEAQGRGFCHGHGKGHSCLGSTLRWLRRSIVSGFSSAVAAIRRALLDTASTVQYDAAREPGRQLGVELRAEPFTARQQRQSRMDGGEDEDGTEREYVAVEPPVVQPHLEREINRAAAENRQPLLGSAAYHQLPLTGAFASVFPPYRQMTSFGALGDAVQLAGDCDAPADVCARQRRLCDLFTLSEDGSISGVRKSDGTEASDEDIAADARAWAVAFANDSFNNHCCHHEHDCTETCIKYAKKQLEAKQSLRSHKVPSCRFWFFRIKVLGRKRRRRRGKPLVREPHIADTDERNQEFRCQVKREQPFRSTSNDCGLVTDRGNIDFQFLPCAPPLPQEAESNRDAPQPAPKSPGTKRWRLTKKTRSDGTKKSPVIVKKKSQDYPTWFPCASQLTESERASVRGFAASFQKAAAMDFYITKYQGKPMQSLAPLFMTMLSGIHRLEEQEEQEKQQAEAEESVGAARPDADTETSAVELLTSEPKEKKRRLDASEQKRRPDASEHAPKKRRKTTEELARRARRVTIRLASMANRCFWVSAAELVVHMLTDGDCLQSHRHQRVFTRQLQWAMQQCKRHLNGQTPEEPMEQTYFDVQTVSFQLAAQENQAEDSGGAAQRTDDGDDEASHGASQPVSGDENLAEDPSGSAQPAEDESDEGADDQNDASSEVSFDKVEASTSSTNSADDYAHRGEKLSAMPYYVYRMYVMRVAKPRAKTSSMKIFFFEEHYALARTYAQEVMLTQVDIPTIHGFQCPTLQQDAEENALLKTILFSPWRCTDPMQCGSVGVYRKLLSDNTCALQGDADDAPQLAEPAATSRRSFTFKRAWKLRHSEIQVLAGRADCRCDCAKKKLVLADTTAFAQLMEPKADIEHGEEILEIFRLFCRRRLRRSLPSNGARLVLAFLDISCKAHPEQCTIAEFAAYICRDVAAHVDLAAEARSMPKKKVTLAEDSADDTASDSSHGAKRDHAEFFDLGGGDADASQLADECDEDVAPRDLSNYPLRNVAQAISMTLQKDDLEDIANKTKLSHSDQQLLEFDAGYKELMTQNFSMDPGAFRGHTVKLGRALPNAIALQKKIIELAKKQQTPDADAEEEADASQLGQDFSRIADDTAQLQEVQAVPVPDAVLGPAHVAWKLLTENKCTEEQKDAVALLALCLQRKFDKRPDKTTHILPTCEASGNHRAVWLGGGGVGKTHTLTKVVQPLAETYFGPDGFSASAQSNHAAHNLGTRGRTLHAANGLLMTDSLQTARLRLNSRTQKKMDHLVGNLGVDAIDELGAVPADLFHADALRKTYGRATRYGLDPTRYMEKQETWGRMAAKILSGDFFQLPPVPPSASLLADPMHQSYEHQQGHKLLQDVEYVVNFVEMKRFEDDNLIEILHAMRTPGGKLISEEAWRALQATVVNADAPQPGLQSAGAHQSNDVQQDTRLRDARNWYECAYEWRLVSYAMHAHARLNAKAESKILFYIPSVDVPSVRLSREHYDEMRAQPNISTSAKMPGIMPIYVGMEMILTDSFLPPKIARGTPVVVVDMELHPREPPVHNRASIAAHGCVLLEYMPSAIYVRVKDCHKVFLQPGADDPQLGDLDLKGILAVQPVSRPWKFQPKSRETTVWVSRTQFPLLPQKQCTLHGVQGKTADPGFIANWAFPKNLSKESIWLAYYVSLSRPRSLSRLLCRSMPDRDIIEGGPPESITKAFDKLFTGKIQKTNVACARAREEMGWPPHR